MRGRSVFVLAGVLTVALGLLVIGASQHAPSAGADALDGAAGGTNGGGQRGPPDGGSDADAPLDTPRAPPGIDDLVADAQAALEDANDTTDDLPIDRPGPGDQLPTGPGGSDDLPQAPDAPNPPGGGNGTNETDETNETPRAPPEIIFDDTDSPHDFAPAFRFGVATKSVAVDLEGRDTLRFEVTFAPYGSMLGVSNSVNVRLLDPDQRTAATCAAGGPISEQTQCVRVVGAQQGSWTVAYDGQGSYKAMTRLLLS